VRRKEWGKLVSEGSREGRKREGNQRKWKSGEIRTH